ncbi:MAG: OmpA family protein [Cyclobacteriaceae bacterium]
MKRYCVIFLFFFIPLSIIAQSEDQKKESPDYIIKSIYFGGGSNYVDEVQVSELYQLIDSIPNIDTFTITIHSHTDNIGGKEYNEWLSQKRSQMVISKLLEKGLLKDLIKQRDFGQLNPVYDNSTFIGRMKNRRVDIVFWPSAL